MREHFLSPFVQHREQLAYIVLITSSNHVHVTIWVTTPPSLVPSLDLTQNPHTKMQGLCTIIGLWCNPKCTTYVSLNKPISNLTKPACTCSCIPIGEYPSCLHTTLASEVLQESSHAVPHVLLLQISTLPSYLCVPPWSLISPLVHGAAVKDNIRLWIEMLRSTT